ncbi:helix-turn-helix domain-containing protein [Nocardiopsis valliformis]|uniref:helix-turn-helix domain-containing protein n=1 Tax=Nocardiopsis valliformis TaxID=239974 RepID=UPI000585025E|nr:helix-turn-helix transcriptional regulator [Nocardiopsis valliformis]
MNHGFSPTIRRRRLARILRDYREESGHTLDTAAKESGVPRSTIGRLEGPEGKRIQTAHLDALARLYNMDEESWRSLHQLAKDAGERGWWSKYKDVFSTNGLPSFEVEASCIRTYQAQVLPGLLQTADYTRAVFTGTGAFQEEQVQRHVAGRLKRQEILERLYPPEYIAIVDEAALRRFAGGPEVMREQLEHLTDVAQRPRVSIHVLPFSAGIHAAHLGSFQILEFPEPTDPTIGYMDTPTCKIFSEEDEEIRRYEAMWREAHNASLTAAQSMTFIQDLSASLKGTT